MIQPKSRFVAPNCCWPQWFGLVVLLTLTSLVAQAQRAETVDFWRSQWAQAGIQTALPNPALRLDVTSYGAVGDSTKDCRAAFVSAIAALAGRPGVIYVPPGKYRVTRSISLPSNAILRGAGSAQTSIIFDFGTASGESSISISGSTNGAFWGLAGGYQMGSDWVTSQVAQTLAPGDYIQILQDNLWETVPPTSWAARSVGQVVQVRYVIGNKIFLREPIRINFRANLNPVARRVTPKEWVGIENIRLRRMANGPGVPCNVTYTLAANCWMEGVDSHFSAAAHVLASQSTHLQFTSCYYQDGFVFDGTGTRGYGILFNQQTGMSRVENCAFRRLRHALTAKEGANGNVFGYNYCREPFRTEFPSNAGADLLLHGFWPVGNLFEGNVAQFFQASAYWGPAGPFNASFRNRLELYGLYFSPSNTGSNTTLQTDSTLAIGNDITGTGTFSGFPLGYFGMSGQGNWRSHNTVQTVLDTALRWAQIAALPSLYRPTAPTWWTSAFSYAGIGHPNQTATGGNPAYNRWLTGVRLPIDRVLGVRPPDLLVSNAQNWTAAANSITVVRGGSLTLSGNVQIDSVLAVRSGASLMLRATNITGNGRIQIDSGATVLVHNTVAGLSTGATNLFRNTGPVLLSNDLHLIISGTTAALGPLCPARLSQLTIQTSVTVRLQKPVRIQQQLRVDQGLFDLQRNRLTIGTEGTFLPMTSTSCLANADSFLVERRWQPITVPSDGGYWQLIGPVVGGQQLQNWAQNNQIAISTYDTTVPNRGSIFQYNPSSRRFVVNNGYVKPSTPTATTAIGTGSRLWTAPINPNAIHRFVGVPQAGPWASPRFPFCVSNCAFVSPNGWALMANPYLAPVNWDSPGVTLTDVYPAIYTWHRTIKQWKTYLNGVGTLGGNGMLSPSEGYFVQATSPNASISIGPAAFGTMSAPLRRAAWTSNRLTLQLEQAGKLIDEAILIQDDSASTAINPAQDATKRYGDLGNIAWSKAGLPMAITAARTIRDRYFVLSGGTGLFDLKLTGPLADSLSGLALIDSSGRVYPFIGQAQQQLAVIGLLKGTYHFGRPTTTLDAGPTSHHFRIYPNPTAGRITIDLRTETNRSIQITNLLGQVQMTTTLYAGTNELDLSALAKGVYLVQVQGLGVQRVVKE